MTSLVIQDTRRFVLATTVVGLFFCPDSAALFCSRDTILAPGFKAARDHMYDSCCLAQCRIIHSFALSISAIFHDALLKSPVYRFLLLFATHVVVIDDKLSERPHPLGILRY